MNTKENTLYSEQKVFAAACAGILLFGMSMLSLGTVNTFLAGRFHLDQVSVGSLAALLPFGIIAGSLLFGPVVDRLGYKLPLAVATFLLAFGFLMVARAESFPAVQLSFCLIGFGGGILNGSTNALVAEISGENRGARLSLLGVFFGIGALGMPALTGILQSHFSYPQIIGGFAVAILVPILYMVSIHFPAPKQSQGFPLRQMVGLLREKVLLVLGMALFFESAAEGLVNNWTPAYLQQARSLEAGFSLLMLTLLSASLTGARLVLGWALKRIPDRTVLICCLTSAVMGALLLFAATTHVVAAFAMILLGIGFSAAFPVLFSYIGGLYPGLTGTAIGVSLVIALAGNTLLNYVLGVVAEAWGIGIFPGYMVAVLVCLGVFLLPGLRTYSLRISSSRN